MEKQTDKYVAFYVKRETYFVTNYFVYHICESKQTNVALYTSRDRQFDVFKIIRRQIYWIFLVINEFAQVKFQL